MMDVQAMDFAKTAFSTIVGGGIALLAVFLTSRSDAEKRRKELLLGRGEELYALSGKWINYLFGCYQRRDYVMAGKLTYNQILDLEIADGRQNTFDFGRIEMLIDVYFPSTRPAYDRLIKGRDNLSVIVSQHKRAYEAGDTDGTGFREPFLKAQREIELAGTSLKNAIIERLLTI